MANVTRTVVVQGNLADVYRLWTEFENFAMFMRHIRSVRRTGPDATHWVMEGPLGTRIEWDARTTVLEPNSRVAWQSTGGDIEQSGSVIFDEVKPAMIRITATIDFSPPGGELGERLVEFFGDLPARVQEDLDNFKAYARSQLVRSA